MFANMIHEHEVFRFMNQAEFRLKIERPEDHENFNFAAIQLKLLLLLKKCLGASFRSRAPALGRPVTTRSVGARTPGGL